MGPTIQTLPVPSLPAFAGILLGLAILGLAARAILGAPHAMARRPGLIAARGVVYLLLFAILANPVRVERVPSEMDPAEATYILDASASMSLGEGQTRFDAAIETIRRAHEIVESERPVLARVFSFGAAVQSIAPGDLGISSPQDGAESSELADRPRVEVSPVQKDSRLLEALRVVARVAGRYPSPLVVVLSDGQAREPEAIQEMAGMLGRERTPVHVVPVGSDEEGGDVALVSLVVPERVRKHSEVVASVWVRSYGFEGVKTRLELSALDGGESVPRTAQEIPITLRNGIQSFRLKFRSGLGATSVTATVPLQPGEISEANNSVSSRVLVDRTKIRILVIEGESAPSTSAFGVSTARNPLGPSPLAQALSGDTDIECTVLRQIPGTDRLQDVDAPGSSFPGSAAVLFAHDAIILNDAPAVVIEEDAVEWVREWVAERGAGLCMVAGPRSFGAGGWSSTAVADILPVVWVGGSDWNAAERVTLRPIERALSHPIWAIVLDPSRNRDIVVSAPPLVGRNGPFVPKPASETLGIVRGTVGEGTSGAEWPAVVVGSYGKGRAVAIGVPAGMPGPSSMLERWRDGENDHAAKLWRNIVYWLTENSAIGRRRLVVSTDKLSYRPGQTVRLDAAVYDEDARALKGARVVVVAEPADGGDAAPGDASPLFWPRGSPRDSGSDDPLACWGEEILVPERADGSGHWLELALVGELPGGAASHSLRLEMSAYDAGALIDSVSTVVQILEDPFELRNPLTRHDLLREVARRSGGTVIETPEELAGLIAGSRPAEERGRLRHEPLWDTGWLAALLLLVLSIDWIWRKVVGLS